MTRFSLSLSLSVLTFAAGCASRQPPPVVVEQAASIDTNDPSWKPAEESGVVFDEKKFDTPKNTKKKAKTSTSRSRLTLPGHEHPIGGVHSATE
jgi:hypothetical protein